MDLLVLAFQIAFEGSLAAAAGLLLLTYVAFTRMNKDLRRARMFIMADRVKRFLGAFTFGFLAIVAASVLTIAGLPTANVVFPAVIVLFLGAILYGSLELFLIVRPRPLRRRAPSTAAAQRPSTDLRGASPSGNPEEGDVHVSR